MAVDEPGIDRAVEGLDVLRGLSKQRYLREPRHACINTALVPAASERGLMFFVMFERHAGIELQKGLPISNL